MEKWLTLSYKIFASICKKDWMIFSTVSSANSSLTTTKFTSAIKTCIWSVLSAMIKDALATPRPNCYVANSPKNCDPSWQSSVLIPMIDGIEPKESNVRNLVRQLKCLSMKRVANFVSWTVRITENIECPLKNSSNIFMILIGTLITTKVLVSKERCYSPENCINVVELHLSIGTPSGSPFTNVNSFSIVTWMRSTEQQSRSGSTF